MHTTTETQLYSSPRSIRLRDFVVGGWTAQELAARVMSLNICERYTIEQENSKKSVSFI